MGTASLVLSLVCCFLFIYIKKENIKLSCTSQGTLKLKCFCIATDGQYKASKSIMLYLTLMVSLRYYLSFPRIPCQLPLSDEVKHLIEANMEFVEMRDNISKIRICPHAASFKLKKQRILHF